MSRKLLLLALCQGLFLSNNVTFIAINGLVWLGLATLAWIATLPVAGYVAGGALEAPLVTRDQCAWAPHLPVRSAGGDGGLVAVRTDRNELGTSVPVKVTPG